MVWVTDQLLGGNSPRSMWALLWWGTSHPQPLREQTPLAFCRWGRSEKGRNWLYITLNQFHFSCYFTWHFPRPGNKNLRFVKETHAMRVEATSKDGRRCICVQAHQSFRRCVAQSAAEFVLHLLESSWGSRYRWYFEKSQFFAPKHMKKQHESIKLDRKRWLFCGFTRFQVEIEICCLNVQGGPQNQL